MAIHLCSALYAHHGLLRRYAPRNDEVIFGYGGRSSMPEMAVAREDHRKAGVVSGLDHFIIAH